jgi:hypothetical protein
MRRQRSRPTKKGDMSADEHPTGGGEEDGKHFVFLFLYELAAPSDEDYGGDCR